MKLSANKQALKIEYFFRPVVFVLFLYVICSSSAEPVKQSELSNGCELYLDDSVQVQAKSWTGGHPSAIQKPLSIKIATANVSGIFSLEGELRKWMGLNENSPLSPQQENTFAKAKSKHLKALASMVRSHDIIAIQEAESAKAASAFSRQYLNDSYVVVMTNKTPTHPFHNNLFLVRKSLSLHFRYQNFTNLIVRSDGFMRGSKKLFPHNFPVLVISDKDNKQIPLAILANTHVQLHRRGQRNEDPVLLRSSQVEVMRQLLNSYRFKFKNKNVPVLLMGDMNEKMDQDVSDMKLAFRSLFVGENPFEDTLDLNDMEQRATVSYWGGAGRVLEQNQRDAILISSPLDNKKIVTNSFVFRYRDGSERMELPIERSDLLKNTFDHFPISAEISLESIRRQYAAQTE